MNSTETSAFSGSEVFGVAGVALAYRELARRGFTERRSLWDDFRRSDRPVSLSPLGLTLTGEFTPADFAVIRLIRRLDDLDDASEWEQVVKEQARVYTSFTHARRHLEPLLHALDVDARFAIEANPRLKATLARWGEVERAMETFEASGATRPLPEFKLEKAQWDLIIELHDRIAAVAGELYVD